MKQWLSKKKRRRGTSAPLSLFPFLAVLLCAMGAMIVLLIAVIRQVRLQAAAEGAAKIAEAQHELTAARELTQWRVSQFRTSIGKAEEDLRQTRLKLAPVEEHTRELRAELAGLETAWRDLEGGVAKDGQRRDSLKADQQRLAHSIEEARRSVATAGHAAQKRPPSFAVVPYDGPNGTRRPPLYLECLADKVVLQPEGIELGVSDFTGPMEPGNPLDQALRAARQSMLQRKIIKGDGSDEPYPLLLVRPKGIAAYYAARAAIQSWRGEVGYELIGDDWRLAFPKPDPALAGAIQNAVNHARAELSQQKVLLALASGQVPDYGLQGSGEGRAPGVGQGPVASTGLGRAPGTGPAAARLPGPPRSLGGAPGERYGEPGATVVAQGDQEGVEVGNPKRYRVAPSGGLILEKEPEKPLPKQRRQLVRGGDPSVRDDSNSLVQTLGVTPRVGRQFGSGDGNPPAATRPVGAADAAATPGPQRTDIAEPQRRVDGAIPQPRATREEMAKRASLERPSQEIPPGAVAQAERPGEWMPRDPQPPKQEPPTEKGKGDERRKTKRLADTRGKNWALPDAARGSVGVSRPIRLRCYSDRLELLRDANDVPSQVLPFGHRTEDFMDAMVSAVWDHMKEWGIAGRGMYWHPMLRIQVESGGEQRFAEIKTLLEGSGLDVKESNLP